MFMADDKLIEDLDDLSDLDKVSLISELVEISVNEKVFQIL